MFVKIVDDKKEMAITFDVSRAYGERSFLMEWGVVLRKSLGYSTGTLRLVRMYRYLSRFGYCLAHLQN